MGNDMDMEGTLRLRVIFVNYRFLNNSELLDGEGRCWLLLKPSIVTIADLASHLCEKFAIRNRIVLFIDDFVLPPFESTRILKNNDIIRVKLKNVKLKDTLLPCDGQNIVHDPQIAKAHVFPFNNNIMADEISQANSQGNGSNVNTVHEDNIGVLQQKREHSLELNNSMQQSEGVNNSPESEAHIACDVEEDVQPSAATSKNDQNQFTEMKFKGKKCCSDGSDFCMENHASIERKPEGGDISDNKAMTVKYKIDFATLFPMTRSPLKGDILAYRYVEPSSTVYPVLSSPQVGKVSAFDSISSEIILISAPEFEIFSEENPEISILPQTVLPYKEDGSLEIKLSSLIDVRLLKAHNSEELACLPKRTFNGTKKDEWEMSLVKNNWNQSDVHHTGRANGARNIANERRPSTSRFNGRRPPTSRFNGASPAAALFWETMSKGYFP